MKVQVIQGRRYAAGVKVPFFVPDTVIGTELLKSDSLGWTNALKYDKGQDPWDYKGDHTHVLVATRSGPSEVIDTEDPKFGGVVLWLKEAYPDMPMPTDPTKSPNVLATDPVSTGTMVAAAAGIVLVGVFGAFFLSSYARL
jgi:ABC-type sulfate transport system permease component